MEVKLSLNVNQATKVGASAPAPVQAPKVDQPASFGQTDALNESLKSTPDVRAEAVQRAKDLIADPSYPPPAVIRSISNLLAISLADDKKD